jgi:hypothetical protein
VRGVPLFGYFGQVEARLADGRSRVCEGEARHKTRCIKVGLNYSEVTPCRLLTLKH